MTSSGASSSTPSTNVTAWRWRTSSCVTTSTFCSFSFSFLGRPGRPSTSFAGGKTKLQQSREKMRYELEETSYMFLFFCARLVFVISSVRTSTYSLYCMLLIGTSSSLISSNLGMSCSCALLK